MGSETGRIGKRILERLSVLGLSQAEAARRAGVAPSWLSDLLAGRKKSVQTHKLNHMAQALLTTRAYLLGETGDPSPAGVGDPGKLAQLLPHILAAPPIERRSAPVADFVEVTRANRGLLFRPNTPQITRPFINSEMLRTLRRRWDEAQGPDERPRIPLFADPVAGVPGAVRQASGLPDATLSVPVLGDLPGAYAIAIPDASLWPAVQARWLAYVGPGTMFFAGLVCLRIVDPLHGAIFKVRMLLDRTDENVTVATLDPFQAEIIRMEAVRSVHPVYATSRDPAVYAQTEPDLGENEPPHDQDDAW